MKAGRYLSIILSLMIMLSFMPSAAFAAGIPDDAQGDVNGSGIVLSSEGTETAVSEDDNDAEAVTDADPEETDETEQTEEAEFPVAEDTFNSPSGLSVATEGSYPQVLYDKKVVLYEYDWDPYYGSVYSLDECQFEYENTLQDDEVLYAYFEASAEPIIYESKIKRISGAIYNSNDVSKRSFTLGKGSKTGVVVDRNTLGTDGFRINIFNNLSEATYTVKCRIVKYKGYATGVSIPKTASLKTENSTTLSPTFTTPEGAYAAVQKWTSSNKNIAKVDSKGKITAMSKGSCDITVTAMGGATSTCKVTVTDPAPRLNIKSELLYKGETLQLKLKFATHKVKWTSSNKKIATVTKSGKVKGKKIGKCYIIAKSGGKTYKCKIKVIYLDPDFGAFVDEYNTRNNYFVVKFRNVGSKTLTITSGIKAENYDYKSYDRKVRIKKKVTIKPFTTKYVKFYVNGGNTWPNYRRFSIFYKFIYDGKEYKGEVWHSNSKFRDSGSWLETYWDDDWYDEWYG